MNRRKAMKTAAGIIAGGGAGLLALTYGFRPEKQPVEEPQKLDYTQTEGSWKYTSLDPEVTAQLAYNFYNEGSCMYGIVKSVISQLAQIFGEPYASFPVHMFRYGHGGMGGYGSVCGAVNGAAALIGLLIANKDIQDRLIGDMFRWYEKEPFPAYRPAKAVFDFVPVPGVSNSILCHASNTNWCKISGYGVASDERKERCRRLTADVARKVAVSLNDLTANVYVTGMHSNDPAGTCVACHGNEGKVKNIAVKMDCTSCHSESIGHKVFSDIHYKLMKE